MSEKHIRCLETVVIGLARWCGARVRKAHTMFGNPTSTNQPLIKIYLSQKSTYDVWKHFWQEQPIPVKIGSEKHIRCLETVLFKHTN